jgi:hypothetical protein
LFILVTYTPQHIGSSWWFLFLVLDSVVNLSNSFFAR